MWCLSACVFVCNDVQGLWAYVNVSHYFNYEINEFINYEHTETATLTHILHALRQARSHGNAMQCDAMTLLIVSMRLQSIN